MYTLIEIAKLNGLDPEAYSREVFSRVADHPITASTIGCPGTCRPALPFWRHDR